ncbi:hypothetical protein BJ508DRAFT_130981 [Ascobolus immersus RN42]|uniref:Uncharacterized protein n=1 Tax=Ascobolus immersus RN42 TaxID=1160509 RepID=A0A3N4I3V1_ASCIM|nr:hypothetical protein BJ508DRAFT_130981 [Ascobolus immersus RN42]
MKTYALNPVPAPSPSVFRGSAQQVVMYVLVYACSFRFLKSSVLLCGKAPDAPHPTGVVGITSIGTNEPVTLSHHLKHRNQQAWQF